MYKALPKLKIDPQANDTPYLLRRSLNKIPLDKSECGSMDLSFHFSLIGKNKHPPVFCFEKVGVGNSSVALRVPGNSPG